MAESEHDVCKCGDYRRQHEDGKGRCMLGSLCTPTPCHKFRPAAAASKPVIFCGCGKVLENPAVYAVHCREFPDHFNNSN